MNKYLLVAIERPEWIESINKSQLLVFLSIIGFISVNFLIYRSLNKNNEEESNNINNDFKEESEKEVEKKEVKTPKENSKTSKQKTKNKKNLKVDTKPEEKTIHKEVKKVPKKDLNKINWNANGSGFFISRDGYIATNHHVISNEKYSLKNLAVEFNYKDEIRIFSARVIRSDNGNDLAIIKIEDDDFKPLRSIPYSLRNNDAELGEEVFALGYPMALTLMGTDIKFTDGRISSKTGFKGNIATYQSTTPIQPGNSGGPLFDFNGNLLGINSSGLSKEIVDNVSYTIKTSYLVNLVNVLPKKISFKKNNSLGKLTMPEKIKALSKVVVLIKVELE